MSYLSKVTKEERIGLQQQQKKMLCLHTCRNHHLGRNLVLDEIWDDSYILTKRYKIFQSFQLEQYKIHNIGSKFLPRGDLV